VKPVATHYILFVFQITAGGDSVNGGCGSDPPNGIGRFAIPMMAIASGGEATSWDNNLSRDEEKYE